MDQEMREKAAKTAVDGFIVVERIYRHTYQTLMTLKDKVKTDYKLKAESPLYNNYQSSAVPETWLYHFKGLYLAKMKISFEEYRENELPILFFQASLYNPDKKEPVFRYGLIDKVFNFHTWKGARFDDYFRIILIQIHSEQQSGHIKTDSCEAELHYDEKPLLDIREEKDITALAEAIGDKYAKLLLA